MATSERSFAAANNSRRPVRIFTPNLPQHHPFLDPSLPHEDIDLVPADLAPRGKLNWEFPKTTTRDIHIKLKLTNKADELLDDWRQKIPQIDEVIKEWSDTGVVSPTTDDEIRRHAQAKLSEYCDYIRDEADSADTSNTFITNIANLSSSGRGEIIYDTYGVKYGVRDGTGDGLGSHQDGEPSNIPRHIRRVGRLNCNRIDASIADSQIPPELLETTVDALGSDWEYLDSSTFNSNAHSTRHAD